MPKFEVTFEREVVIYETCTRVIEAATAKKAEAKAWKLAASFNHSCPDDATEDDGRAEFGDWEPEVGDETDEEADEVEA